MLNAFKVNSKDTQTTSIDIIWVSLFFTLNTAHLLYEPMYNFEFPKSFERYQ